jgi:hypothetical protein
MVDAPLIVALKLDPEAQDFFNVLRKQWFPASRNFIDAHLTLFHALPNTENILSIIRNECYQQTAFQLRVLEPVSIGKGVAYKLESKDLMLLHKRLQEKWVNFLTQQDKQTIWPHITIQNKVPPEDAVSLLAALKKDFEPFHVHAKGLQVWEYLQGPWSFLQEFNFKPG